MAIKSFRCTDFRDINFEVLHSEIVLDKADLDFIEAVKSEPAVNDSDFTTYSNTINFLCEWLDNSGCI